MKSSNLSNSPWYSLLALYMPLGVLIAWVFIVDALFPGVLSLALLIGSFGISALAASFYCDFMKDDKASRIAANIRGGIIVMGFFYVSTSLLRREIPWNERFAPNLSSILVSGGALFTWIEVISLKQIFSARRRFEIYTETYQGEQLQKVLFEDPALLQYTDTYIIKARRNYLFQLIFTGIFTIIAVINKGSLPLPLFILLIAILAGGICIFGFFGIIRWEQYYAGEGIGLSALDRSKRMLGMGVFALLAITAALLLASEKSILSFSLITGFFAWFFGLFRRLFLFLFQPTNKIAETETFESPEFISPFFIIPEEDTSVSIWKLIFQYGFVILKYGIIIFAAFRITLFMIEPLINRSKSPAEKPSFFRRLGDTILELLKGILNGLLSFLSHLRSGAPGLKLRKPGAQEIRQTAQTILGAYAQAKKRDMRQSVTLFARLIIWGGEARQVVWKPVYAPGEYCGILAVAGDTHSEEIIRCGELFEQAMYSAEVLSDAERKEFKNLVETITA